MLSLLRYQIIFLKLLFLYICTQGQGLHTLQFGFTKLSWDKYITSKETLL